MIDPTRRWSTIGEKPDYAGLLTFGGLRYTEEADELEGVDVAIIGAPMDELVSERPGTRHGPRAIRAASALGGAHLEVGIDPFERLSIVDFGDAAVLPADPVRSHVAIEELVGLVARTGTLPLVLGGDHSIAEPDIRGCASAHGSMGLIHLDAHTDTGRDCYGVELSHGTPMYRLVEAGVVDPARYVQIGLRGYWPGEDVFAWQRERGITALFMHDVRKRGLEQIVREAIECVGAGPVFLSVDIDVLDPAFAPGTGTPEPGGITSAELLWACRTIAEKVELSGADVVEVCPTQIGTADITALVASRAVHEILTGIALGHEQDGDQRQRWYGRASRRPVAGV